MVAKPPLEPSLSETEFRVTVLAKRTSFELNVAAPETVRFSVPTNPLVILKLGVAVSVPS